MSECPPGKTCPHQRAFEFALGYFSTDHPDDAKIPAILVKRYREALKRQRIIEESADE